jgi:hypothetical protein
MACLVLLAAAGLLQSPALAQDDNSVSVTCEFNSGKQVVLHYTRPTAKSDTPQNGKPWMPGGSAITLFTQAPLQLGGTLIPPGGYTVYLIPAKRNWTVVVSHNTKVDAAYDPAQDVAKTTMESGQLSNKEDTLTISLGHMGAQQCELNVDYGMQRSWAEFKEK